MRAIRAFVAVLIDDDLRNNISRVQNEVRKLAPDVKWVAPENLHVTLKFLGNVTEEALPKVFAAVEKAAQSIPAFDLSVTGLGAFPSPQRARVVWVGIEKGRDELIELAEAVESELVSAGFEREEKAFKAHITIGRARMDRPLKGLAEGFARIDASNLGSMRVSDIAVMQSDLKPGGPVYSAMKIVPLAA
jgi:2'-5' RNA ligase